MKKSSRHILMNFFPSCLVKQLCKNNCQSSNKPLNSKPWFWDVSKKKFEVKSYNCQLLYQQDGWMDTKSCKLEFGSQSRDQALNLGRALEHARLSSTEGTSAGSLNRGDKTAGMQYSFPIFLN